MGAAIFKYFFEKVLQKKITKLKLLNIFETVRQRAFILYPI